MPQSSHQRPSPLQTLRQAAKSVYEYAYEVLSPNLYPKMKFQVVSDIHLEIPPERPPLGIIKLGSGNRATEEEKEREKEKEGGRGRRGSCFTAGDGYKEEDEENTREARRGGPKKDIDGGGDGGGEDIHTKEGQEEKTRVHKHYLAKCTSYLSYDKLLPGRAQFLILAGDIGLLNHYDLYLHFLKVQLQHFEKVFLVLGNHEFYSLPGGRSAGYQVSKRLEYDTNDKVQVLHRKRVDIPYFSSPDKDSLNGNGGVVTLLGCTLNSFVPSQAALPVSKLVNDFKKIENWTVDAHNHEFLADLLWLKETLREISDQDDSTKLHAPQTPSSRRIVVVTHHAPTYKDSSKPREQFSHISSAFCTELLYPTSHPSSPNPTTDVVPVTLQINNNATNLSPFSLSPSTISPTSTPSTLEREVKEENIEREDTTTSAAKDIEEKVKHAIGGGLSSWPGSQKVVTWIFGHTHFCTDYVYRGNHYSSFSENAELPLPSPGNKGVKVHIVANQRGYWLSGESGKYDPGFVVEV